MGITNFKTRTEGEFGMSRFIKIFFIALVIVLLNAGITKADNSFTTQSQDPEWLAAKKSLENLVQEEKCSEYWNILWPWAKKGNLEARALLLISLAPPPDMNIIYAPGSSGDYISKLRDITIMSVHSHGYKEKWFEDYKNLISDLYVQVGFDEISAGKDFLKCVKDTPSANCIDIAVKEKLVPSFEEYASQIDALMKEGMKSTCN
ncbi:MAG: hypothetical protein IT558_01995 [Alphaproteobacteria bacterium]|nr:hypothetical protein [Alphaproteobacteria bacterium]